MATHVSCTWKEFVGVARSDLLSPEGAFRTSTFARIDISYGGGNEAWFFRDEADWVAFEDLERDVNLDEPGVVREDPCEGQPSMMIECDTEEEFLAAVAAAKAGGYHGGCLFEPV
jgi:hypothetical protein